MTLIEICQLQDISVKSAERALANLQEKGLVTGYVPGDLKAEVTFTPQAAEIDAKKA